MQKLWFLVIMLLSLNYSSNAENIVLNVAVNDLITKNIKEDIGGIISDRLRSELINTNIFRVMERLEMDEVLKEQAFQQTGVCDESSCLVEIGQVLGVDRMIAGSVGKISSTLYTISLRIIDVATGEIILTVCEDHEGDIKGVLSIAISKAAQKLAGSTFESIKKGRISHLKGDLYISSDIKGATIEINGKQIEGVTPLTLYEYPVGELDIIVRKGKYTGFKTINLEPEDLLKINVPMKKGSGACKIFSTPDEATVFIDDKRIGNTPIKVNDLIAGEHKVTIVKYGYLTYNGFVIIDVGETRNMSVDLEPAAYLELKVIPNNFELFINGKSIEYTKNIPVKPGDLELKIVKHGYETFIKKIRAEKNLSIKVDAHLKYLLGGVNLKSSPPGAKVYINFEEKGQTPYINYRLDPGDYKVKIEKSGFDPIVELLNVKANASVEKNYILKRSQEWRDSVKNATETQNARKKNISKWVRRASFGCGAIGFGIGAIVSNRNAQNDINKASEIQTDYNNNTSLFDGSEYIKEYNNANSSADKNIIKRNIFTGISGGFLILFGISIPF